MNQIRSAYTRLLSFHGPQGWWPIIDASIPRSEYHVGAPRNGRDFFEISIGAILTQNIAWKNVDTALSALKTRGILDPASLRRMRLRALAGIIRPTGYYNQKAIKIKNFMAWYRRYEFDYRRLQDLDTAFLRTELLDVNGIGPETADSILLYGLGRGIFVVDAYTRRIFTRLGVLSGNEGYHEIQEIFHRRFHGTAQECNEYHALIVAHGKDYCKKRPRCDTCCLSRMCDRNI